MILQRKVILAATAAAFGVGGLTGCQSLSNKERGAIIGAATGGAVGAAVGSKNGGVARGAIIGAAVGGAAGAIIGHQMDQQAKELEQNIPGAIVERVGEGIEVTFQSGLLYDFDSSDLKPEARTNLQNLARSLDRYPNTNLLIAGHTDSVGTDSYNQTLSERRARAAAAYLVSQGVASSRIRTVGMGEREPEASNDTAAGRAQNRRVEVAIYADDQLKAQAKRQAGD
ncbi:MAG TPA: OmpA family protein [Gemmatimonadaceae bacterium]|nr:OmpA family protein [Gemmatimonadaceae bacterium]